MTTLDLLYRNVIDGDDDDAPRGAYGPAELERAAIIDDDEPQVRRVRDVKDWVLRFVGGANTGALPQGRVLKSARLVGGNPMQAALPDDTPRK